jgi:hypothetical protein
MRGPKSTALIRLEDSGMGGKVATHHVAIAIVDETHFQAMCNPFKCGWFGTVTDSEELAELEKENHYKETLSLNSD